MEFNKIAGAIIGTLLLVMVIGKVGNTLVPQYHPPKDKPGVETTQPQTPTGPEKPVAELLAEADAKAGESRARACTSCHTLAKGGANGVGPNLYDIVGRKKGSHAGYAYSDGLKNAGGEWSYDELFKYIANPAGMIPGSKMAFRLANPEQRAQVIAYLRTLSDAPKPLPAVEKKSETPKPEEKKAEPAKPEEKKPEPAKTGEKPAEAPKPAPKAAEPPKAEEPKPAAPAEEKKD
jgi:cytochrome c